MACLTGSVFYSFIERFVCCTRVGRRRFLAFSFVVSCVEFMYVYRAVRPGGTEKRDGYLPLYYYLITSDRL